MADMYQSTYAQEYFNFAAVGDWGCTSDTDDTVDNIRDKDPELVLGLGDFSYEDSASCWLEKIQPIDSITNISIGNEDSDSDRLDQYMDHFGLTQLYYSYDYQNVHILTMTMKSGYSHDSAQFDFVVNDLQNASQNPNIDWIIVYFHKPIYTSPSTSPALSFFRSVYHPLFDEYGVDIVLQGHQHNYQRTFPLNYNPSSASNPIVTSTNNNDYIYPEGAIFAIVGTGGVNLHSLDGKASYVVTQQDDFFGQLDIRFTNNGSKLEGRFYKNDDNEIFDRFSITKNAGRGSGNYTLQSSP